MNNFKRQLNEIFGHKKSKKKQFKDMSPEEQDAAIDAHPRMNRVLKKHNGLEAGQTVSLTIDFGTEVRKGSPLKIHHLTKESVFLINPMRGNHHIIVPYKYIEKT